MSVCRCCLQTLCRTAADHCITAYQRNATGDEGSDPHLGETLSIRVSSYQLAAGHTRAGSELSFDRLSSSGSGLYSSAGSEKSRSPFESGKSNPPVSSMDCASESSSESSMIPDAMIASWASAKCLILLRVLGLRQPCYVSLALPRQSAQHVIRKILPSSCRQLRSPRQWAKQVVRATWDSTILVMHHHVITNHASLSRCSSQQSAVMMMCQTPYSSCQILIILASGGVRKGLLPLLA